MKLHRFILYALILVQKISVCQDSALLAASSQYNTEAITRLVFMGQNYRSTWAMPVKMPVFDISKENGGMVISELSGGQQTKSLYMKDADSVEWVLRSVDKDLEKVMPGLLKNTFAERVIQDMVSAAHPYGALVVAPLAKALGLSAPQPKLFYIPDEPTLGEYRNLFAHSVCMLEKSEPSFDNTHTESTDTVLDKIKRSNKYRVDDSSYLKMRLLDMLVADWDRHPGQLKWGSRSEGTDTIYYAIPRDRDQALFHSNGLMMKITRLFAMKHMTGFRKNTRKVRMLNYKSWDIDKTILADLDEKAWKRIIIAFQQTLDDVTLRSALNELPPEVNQKDGEMIFKKLKARRDKLPKNAMKYRAFISRK